MERKKVDVASTLRQPGRRSLLKASLAIAPVATLGVAHGQWRGGSTAGSSPLTTPFLEPMPIMPLLLERQVTDEVFAHPPTVEPNRALNAATGFPYEGRSAGAPFQQLADRLIKRRVRQKPDFIAYPQFSQRT